MSTDKVVNIPVLLYEELKSLQEKSLFPSIDDLVTYILQEYLDNEKNKTENSNEEQNDIVKDRLKNLGYL